MTWRDDYSADIMKSAAEDTYLLSGACAPTAQKKLFKRIIRESSFNEKHFVVVDIREIDNWSDQAVQRDD